MTKGELDQLLASRPLGVTLNAQRRAVEAPPKRPEGPGPSPVGAAVAGALKTSVGATQLTDEQRVSCATYQVRIDAAREAEESERKATANERAALPEKLAARTDRRIMSAIRQWSPCILILGPTGIGKTSAMRWLQLEHRGTWFSARELAACERRHSLGDGEPPDLARACSPDLLYLDDLGTEDGRDISVLKDVVDRRYSKGYPTVVNTGLTKGMLSERYEAPTVRRLLEQHVRRKDGSEWPVLVVDCHD